MGAVLQDLWNKYVWNDAVSRGIPEGDLHTINGTILKSILAGDGYTGEPITVRKGLKISTVYTCITVRGKTMASLPLNIFRSADGRTEKISDHPTYYTLAHEPNEYMTAANFWRTIMLHHDAWGNGFARINRGSRQRPMSYDIWEPWEVSITKKDGNIFYNYKGETVSSWDILHFRDTTLDGICGLSPILENDNTMGMAIKLDRFQAMTLGARPPGILSYEGNLTPEAMAENRKTWMGGGSDVKVLSGRWKYDAIMNQADQAQFKEAKAANKVEICGIWQMPPTFVQDFERATFSNAEQSDLVYTKHTIIPVATNFEKEINMKCFFENEKATHFAKFNINGLLRGDMAARQSYYQSMINSGVILRNEARELEEFNGYEGGDVPLIQGAMIPGDEEGIEALRKKMETEVIPSAKPVNGKEKHLNGHGVLN